MTQKKTEDYLQEGIYGTRLPKQEERDRFLGSLRERILLALTIGQVMQKKGLEAMETEMKAHCDAKLLLNGDISYSYLKDLKALANQLHIPYTSVGNEEKKSDVGAVLTLDDAIDKAEIFYTEPDSQTPHSGVHTEEKKPFMARIKGFFSS